MNKALAIIMILVFSPSAFAWKYITGKVDVLYVNTYGNYAETHLNKGFCFKLKDHDHYLKVKYYEDGEQKNNIQFAQSIVLAAHMSGKEIKATYVDWGSDTSCRINGGSKPAKWLENIQLLN